MQVPSLRKERFWESAPWQKYAGGLIRYYGRRNGYSVKLTPKVATADVCLELKQVRANPELPRHEPKLAALQRFRLESHPHALAMIRGLLAHEAAHIRFTTPYPGGLLGETINSLEDQRIENLQERDYDVARDFTYLGDYFLLKGFAKGFRGTPLEGCLAWRWQHDHPRHLWHCADPLWDDVRPLVEAAWVAADTDHVTQIAKWIFKLLGIPENAPGDDTFEFGAGAANPQGADSEQSASTGEPDSGSNAGAPEAPDESLNRELEQAFDLACETDALGRVLARSLELPQPAARRYHESRGTLDMRRVVNQRDKVFVRTQQRSQLPQQLVVVQDVSSSMGHVANPQDAHYHAVRAVMALARAVEINGTPLCVVTFNSAAEVVKPFDMTPTETRRVLANLVTGSVTSLHAGLKLVAPLLSGDRRTLLIVLCDGGLSDDDVTDLPRPFEYMPKQRSYPFCWAGSPRTPARCPASQPRSDVLPARAT